MKTFNSFSTEYSRCYKCNKMGGNYFILSECGIDIKIPTCNEHIKLIDSKLFKTPMKQIRELLK